MQIKETQADLTDQPDLQLPDFSRKWFVMLAVAMGIFLATIDGSIVNVALPTLTEGLNTDFAIVQWVVLSYLLTVTTLLSIVGRLADMYGRKRLYTAGFVVFTIGSFLCGLAPTAGWLILFRVLQGVGAALILALGVAIVTEAFPPTERGRALGIAGSIVSIGIVSGPVLGGFIIENLSWHWIFFVNVPIGILGVIISIRHVPESHPPGDQRFDLAGAASLFIFLLALLLGLTTGQRQGFISPPTLILFVISAVFLTVFLWIEFHHAQPIINPRLFRSRLFSVNLTTGFLMFIGLGSSVLIPFYLENVLGYRVQQVGLLLAVIPVALGITAPISGTLSDRFGTRVISIGGLVITMLGYLALSTLTTSTTAVGFMLRYLPVGIGVGLFQSPNNSAIMGAAPRNQLGMASSLLAVTRTLGQTVGIAVLGALWAGLVFAGMGGLVEGGATTAPPEYQVDALQTVALVVACLIGIALLIALWAWRQETKPATSPESL
jgi:EmrB/QacA subfamily drug resistance transporter